MQSQNLNCLKAFTPIYRYKILPKRRYDKCQIDRFTLCFLSLSFFLSVYRICIDGFSRRGSFFPYPFSTICVNSFFKEFFLNCIFGWNAWDSCLCFYVSYISFSTLHSKSLLAGFIMQSYINSQLWDCFFFSFFLNQNWTGDSLVPLWMKIYWFL